MVAQITGHIAIVEGVFGDDASDRFYIRLIEVIPDVGVCRSILDETRLAERNSRVLKVSNADKMDSHAAVDFCVDQLGEDYQLHTPPRYSTYNDQWYCSELVWAAYRVAGIELLSNPGSGILRPAWFYDANNTVVKEISTIMPSSYFVDNNLNWASDSIEFVADNGIMTGMSETNFSPYTLTTRAMVVTVLYRLAGSPSVEGPCVFEDVSNEDLYYYDAVIWGVENGIVQGLSETQFAPKKVVTREQFATFLYRFAMYKGYEITYSNNALNSFTDSSSVSSYALIPMKWAVSNGLINGMTATTLAPKNGSNRAQCATIISRFIQNIMSD